MMFVMGFWMISNKNILNNNKTFTMEMNMLKTNLLLNIKKNKTIKSTIPTKKIQNKEHLIKTNKNNFHKKINNLFLTIIMQIVSKNTHKLQKTIIVLNNNTEKNYKIRQINYNLNKTSTINNNNFNQLLYPSPSSHTANYK